jgi:hypothetical protein
LGRRGPGGNGALRSGGRDGLRLVGREQDDQRRRRNKGQNGRSERHPDLPAAAGDAKTQLWGDDESARSVERGVVAEDGELELLELCSRLESELLVEHLACSAVRLQRLCLSTRAIKRDDQQPAEVLSQRLLFDERVELADELGVPALGEVELDPLFKRHEPKLFEPSDLARCP